MNAVLNRKIVTLGVTSSLLFSAFFALHRTKETGIDPERDLEPGAIKTHRDRFESPVARKVQRLLLEKSGAMNTTPTEVLEGSEQETSVLAKDEESELREAIEDIERDLKNRDTIARLNQKEVDRDEREELKESFMELNELRRSLVRSKLNEIEEKLQKLEEAQEHA